MNKYKYLLKNVGLLTISNLGSKVLSFILIPLYTSVLTTGEYGTYDLYSTTVSLLAPILTLTVANGVMRFCLDAQYDKEEVFTIGIVQELKAIIIFAVLIFINYTFGIIDILNEYPVQLVFLFLGSRVYNFFSLFSRGIGQIFDLAVAGALNSISVLSLNLLFLLYLKLGLNGYFLANILAYIIPGFYLFIRSKAWKYLKIKTKVSTKAEIFAYSKPMIFSNIGWWINNVSDRYIVTWICGIAANGVYSVAYKLPSVLNIFQHIFNQAWALSAVKEANDDSGKFYSEVYAIYNCGMVILCSIMILFNQFIAKLLFSKDFYMAWKYAPYLMISSVFGALIGLLEGVFIATKKTNIIARTTCVGAVVNTILNIALVSLLGPIGAAISTMFSYIVIWLYRLVKAKELIPLKIKLTRDVVAYLLLIIQGLLQLFDVRICKLEIAQLLVIIILALYASDVKVLVCKIKHKFLYGSK